MKTLPHSPEIPITRRAFTVGALAAAAGLGHRRLSAANSATAPPAGGKWRAAIIGDTGRGDYGHSLDVVFNDRDNIEIVAVVDPDAAGRAKAAARTGALRQYGDYREMLEAETPQLVCLASRWSSQRHAIGLAAFQKGAHLFSEKPFTTTLAEADELLATAEKIGAKIAVAHQMRIAPSTTRLKKSIEDGLLGELLEIHAWGKQDARAGGEDMLVLGSHLFDLMRLFAGDVAWCTARVLHAGRDISRPDARLVKEEIGPVAGDEIFAQFAFASGVNGTFTSRKRLAQSVGHWGIEFVGSKNSVRLLADVYPSLYLQKTAAWQPSGRTSEWLRLEGDPGAKLSSEERGFGPANRRVVDDWLEAISNKREPVCSGHHAMKSIEMIMGVYQAALAGGRAAFPLVERRHPLLA